ncbi:MAG: DUF554 family protein, partial [Oscillospiraceae bacterium]|nr:DUF554 family protein [Oscillospiraceae bacterium]
HWFESSSLHQKQALALQALVSFYSTEGKAMRGLGTILNVLGVIVGSGLGLFFRRGIKPRLKETLMQAMGVSVMFLGLAGAMTGLLEVLEDVGVFKRNDEGTSGFLKFIQSL